jgi:hypothetical protein
METHPYYGPGSVVIGNCSRCHVLRLDAAELSTIVASAGRDGGKPPPPVRRPLMADPEQNGSFEAILDCL